MENNSPNLKDENNQIASVLFNIGTGNTDFLFNKHDYYFQHQSQIWWAFNSQFRLLENKNSIRGKNYTIRPAP